MTEQLLPGHRGSCLHPKAGMRLPRRPSTLLPQHLGDCAPTSGTLPVAPSHGLSSYPAVAPSRGLSPGPRILASSAPGTAAFWGGSREPVDCVSPASAKLSASRDPWRGRPTKPSRAGVP